MSRRTRGVLFVLAGIFIALFLSACGQERSQQERSPQERDGQTLLERGETLSANCHACHSPKIFTDHGAEIDSARALSGHPADLGIPEVDPAKLEEGWLSFNEHTTCWIGPWGMAFTRNLTPDIETGIGSWSEEQFIRVVRAGHLPGGEGMAAPMPWLDLRKSSDADLKAIFAYLQSLKPVKNQVPGRISVTSLKSLGK
jgi:mono/diheme cytochrome c family protein